MATWYRIFLLNLQVSASLNASQDSATTPVSKSNHFLAVFTSLLVAASNFISGEAPCTYDTLFTFWIQHCISLFSVLLNSGICVLNKFTAWAGETAKIVDCRVVDSEDWLCPDDSFAAACIGLAGCTVTWFPASVTNSWFISCCCWSMRVIKTAHNYLFPSLFPRLSLWTLHSEYFGVSSLVRLAIDYLFASGISGCHL